jgi:hypothetical protein
VSWAWEFPSDAYSLALSAHKGAEVPPDKVPGIDMPVDSPNEKKNGRSKNTQPTSQVTPAVRQVHVVLWDEPPEGDPQENDTDLEPGHI